MLFSVPIFDTNTYISAPNSYEIGLYIISVYDAASVQFNVAFDSYVEQELQSTTPLIYLSALNATWQDEFTDVINFTKYSRLGISVLLSKT